MERLDDSLISLAVRAGAHLERTVPWLVRLPQRLVPGVTARAACSWCYNACASPPFFCDPTKYSADWVHVYDCNNGCGDQIDWSGECCA